jgi:hypothetical protein
MLVASLSKLPDYLVLRGIRPGGIRLTKIKPWTEPFVSSYRGPSGAYGHMFPRPSVNATAPNRLGDLLANGDIRYWAGTDPSHPYAACRNCGEVAMYHDERKEHLKRGCGGLLTNAYKLLLRRPMRCVICDKESSLSAWGVPLCSKDCREDWSWADRQPDALSAAIALIESVK